MKAVILAAGEGLRLRPFTQTRPKVMLQVAGKPILHHLLIEAKKAGIGEAIIVVRYLKEKIIDYFSQNPIAGLKLKFIDQGKENGTAAAILCAKDEIGDTFVVLAGDTLTEASVIKSVIEGHENSITLAVKKVPNPREYGVVELSGNHVSIFEEKPQHPKSDLANLSVYAMEPTIFNDIKSLSKSKRGEYEIVDLFVGAKAVVVEGYWKDIGFPWDLFEANEFLLDNLDSHTEHIENSTINGKVIMEKGAKIINSYIEGCAYIGENTVIGPNAYLRGPLMIGKNCSIGPGTSIKNSILFDHVNAKHLTYVGDSIIGENVNFGSGTQIANYRFDCAKVNVLTERGWVNSGRNKLGAFVGDNVKFGVLSCIMPGKIIGHGSFIHSTIAVNENIPPKSNVYVKQKLEITKITEK